MTDPRTAGVAVVLLGVALMIAYSAILAYGGVA